MEGDADDELITSITPDVMKSLVGSGFFLKLDELFCPTDGSPQHEICHGDYRLAEALLSASGFDLSELEDIFGVLRARGGCCDCEILYNVAPHSRLRANYWRGRAEGGERPTRHSDR
jgi:hypothetical protein